MELGFIQSEIDPCLFLKPTMFVIVHVDDCGIAYKDEEIVNEFILQLKEKGLELTREESFEEYLGITYQRKENKNLLTQTGLINKILKALDLQKCKPNVTPAATESLGIDPDGEPMKESWSYPSIVGMLLYLSCNTRSDIAFAIS